MRHKELGHFLANGLVFRMAKDPLSGRIEIDDATTLVHRDHGVKRSAEDRPRDRVVPPDCRLGPTAHDEETDEAAERVQGAQKLLVRLFERAREELHRAHDLVGATNRKAEGRAEAGSGSRPRAREARARDHVDDPRWFTARPHPAGQALPAAERDPLAERTELEGFGLRRLPDRDAAEVVARRDLPRRSEVPAERGSDLGQHPFVRFLGIGRLSERPRDRNLDPGRSKLPGLVAPQAVHARHVYHVWRLLLGDP
jgi:hypothetical protein